ncbi:diacylglycerol kinase [Legionella taurinensis]|uniref:Diacylglycerol kinase n=1 Tax=Legionella taurinensis TaxID=70611 RepID=A0A3A5L2E2_9GAMM|nr:diacylglycerol kinase family protein [Legionella taurinensis]MDX1838600.1 diacylglycerol kinase family protein [Legionella taurinensis]PUT39038.1 diacylglycerol kinase [Legionella taurinensis]PUT41125.1 diacylglycerol kinase [Legionella taurinensis]PUT43500.1 diacylglycerol kinase [Legionella taurinensis]PUT46517.1 diacylglycerol kinase [Legionella taurinensis]
MTALAVIINQQAKNAQSAAPFLQGLKEAGMDYDLYEVDADDLDATIKDCQPKYDTLLVGGGDGTVRSAAHYCANTSTVMGVLPLGTLNHFARELVLPLTVEDLVEALKQRTTTVIDLAEVNGQVFVNNSSIGFYPKFARRRDLYSRKYYKWLSYIPSLIDSLRKHPTLSLRVKNEEFVLSLRTSFLMVSNNLYTYEFPATFKREAFTSGRLGLYFFRHGRLRLFKILRAMLNRRSNFEFRESQSPIEIHCQDLAELNVSLDGDVRRMESPLRYKIIPQGLRLITIDKPS